MESSSAESQRSAITSLQNELGLFVVEEHALQRETMRRLWATPLAERVEEGRCISGLRVGELTATGRSRLECEGNHSRFREGDLVRLSRDDPQQPFMEGVVAAISDTRIEVRQWRTFGGQLCAVGESGICIDET